MLRVCIMFVFIGWTITAYTQFKPLLAVGDSIESMRKLMIDPDSVRLSNLLSAQLSYGHSSGRIETKSDFITNLLNGNSDFTEIDLSGDNVTIAGNTAIARHNLAAKTNDKGVPGAVKLHILTVWIKEKKNWKLLARQAVKINP